MIQHGLVASYPADGSVSVCWSPEGVDPARQSATALKRVCENTTLVQFHNHGKDEPCDTEIANPCWESIKLGSKK